MNGRTPAKTFIDGLLKDRNGKEETKRKAAKLTPLERRLSGDYRLCTANLSRFLDKAN